MLWSWARSHVTVEGREIIPLRTYGNPATAIIWVVIAVRIAASLAHSFPDRIFRHAMQVVLAEVAGTLDVLSGRILFGTSARLGSPAPYKRRTGGMLVAALALK